MEINWQQVGDWIAHNIVQICLLLSIFIQITPIKINPWTTLFKWIGKLINADSNKRIDALIEKTDNMKEDIKTLTTNMNENEKDRIRWEILDFANSCRNGRRHTKDEFQHIITLNDKYKNLLALTGDKNGVFEAEYDYIRRLYEERQEKNDFL